MIEFLEFEINGATVRLCFTRMGDDSWFCRMPDEALKDLQAIAQKDS